MKGRCVFTFTQNFWGLKLEWTRFPLVEARKGTMEACLLGKGEKQPSNKDKTDDNNTSEFDYFSVPNTLPITFFPCVNPAYSYCFGGKQTLKDLYFEKQKCGASQ